MQSIVNKYISYRLYFSSSYTSENTRLLLVVLIKTLLLLSINRQVLDGFGGVPPIRPLETLHNALSLKQLDGFLEKMITVPLFKTSSPPTPIQAPQTLPDKIGTLASKFEVDFS